MGRPPPQILGTTVSPSTLKSPPMLGTLDIIKQFYCIPPECTLNTVFFCSGVLTQLTAVNITKNRKVLLQALNQAAPEQAYLRDCCIGTHSSASGLRLRSLEKTDLRVRRMRTHFGVEPCANIIVSAAARRSNLVGEGAPPVQKSRRCGVGGQNSFFKGSR